MEPPMRPQDGVVAEARQDLAELRESTGAWLSGLLAADAGAEEWLAYVEANAPETWRRLQQEESQAREDSTRRAREAQEQSDELERLNSELKDSFTDEGTLEEALASLEGYAAKLGEENAKARAEVEDEARVKDEAREAVRAEITKYKEALGLRFERIEGAEEALRVTYTLIDPLEPQREFSYHFHTTRDKFFKVTECEPPVSNLDDLVKKLNASPNRNSTPVLAFFKEMRNEFRKIVMGSG